MDNIEKDQLEGSKYDAEKGIPEPDLVPFTEWVTKELKAKVNKVILSSRLRESPAVVVGEMPSALRQAYKLMDRDRFNDEMVRGQNLEINPNHELIVLLNNARKSHPELASEILSQVFDNALISADIIENMNPVLKRVNSIMLRLLKAKQNS
jgi:HSP90 family molecular chaperone